MEIKNQAYSIYYDAASATVVFQGSLRLGGMEEYAPIEQLLNNIADQEPSRMTLNLQELEFLNSSGIIAILGSMRYILKTGKPDEIEFWRTLLV